MKVFERSRPKTLLNHSWVSGDKDKSVLCGKIFLILCRKASEYARIPSFCGFVCEKFYCAQNCFAPESAENSRDFRRGGSSLTHVRQGRQAEKDRI